MGVRDWLIKLLENRFRQRFFAPVENILNADGCDHPKIKSDGRGFAVMAICGLTVEVLGCLIRGQWTTFWKKSRDPALHCDPRWPEKQSPKPPSHRWKPAGGELNETKSSYLHHGLYADLLLDLRREDGTLLFGGNGQLAEDFYKSIRCGLLHQAETAGAWTIGNTKGKVIIPSPPKVEASLFFDSLVRRFEQHIKLLKDPSRSAYDSSEWLACRYKVLGICRSSGWQGDEHDGIKVKFTSYWP